MNTNREKKLQKRKKDRVKKIGQQQLLIMIKYAILATKNLFIGKNSKIIYLKMQVKFQKCLVQEVQLTWEVGRIQLLKKEWVVLFLMQNLNAETQIKFVKDRLQNMIYGLEMIQMEEVIYNGFILE